MTAIATERDNSGGAPATANSRRSSKGRGRLERIPFNLACAAPPTVAESLEILPARMDAENDEAGAEQFPADARAGKAQGIPLSLRCYRGQTELSA